MPKCDSNKVALQEDLYRTAFPKNTSVRLLLQIIEIIQQNLKSGLAQVQILLTACPLTVLAGNKSKCL